MANKLLDRVREYFDQDKTVRMVADDVELTAELMLLIRMMFADGRLAKRELANFKRICNTAFGIPEEDVVDVITYIKETGYETTADEAAAMFKGLELERRRALLLHMLSIAKSDDDLSTDEIELIRRTADAVGMSAEDLAKLQG
ncbi:MAG: hypothetical protein GY742_11070 [Hyphomicrobiales bacterium]|nr:hypothetical protein [Hyphomicrobiales bacterium]